MENKNFIVLLYYKYIEVEDPNKEVELHKIFLSKIGLVGRVFISEEGINGTLCGTKEETEKYILEIKRHKLFYDIEFKKSNSNFICFSKLIVKYKEIT